MLTMSAGKNSLAVDAPGAAAEMNRLAASGIPFIFIVDAWAENWVVLDLPRATSAGISWNFEGRGTLADDRLPSDTFRFNTHSAQVNGDSWLANLTFPTELDTDLTQEQLVRCARAPFRLLAADHIAVFSPERFIRITEAGRICMSP